MFALLVAVLIQPAPAPTVVTLGTLKAAAPATWKSGKPSNLLRSHQFSIAAADPEIAPAEVAVFKEASPKVEEKFAEWKATFVIPDGKTADDLGAKTDEFTVADATVHTLDVSGTWKYRERPRDPKSKQELRPDTRVLWVVLIQKEETTHIRLAGPAAVVNKHAAEFLTWIKSAK